MDSYEKICVVSQSSDSRHNVASVEAIAERLAKLTGIRLGSTVQHFDDAERTFFVPTFSLIRQSHPELDAGQFWGGCVDQEFMTTKLATHPAWTEEDALPTGWMPQFARDLEGAALSGYSVFSHDHAAQAGAFLIDKRKIRLKDPYASGGKSKVSFKTTTNWTCFFKRFRKAISLEEW